MTRRAKIARIPYQIRHQLNSRIEDGEPGVTLVEWLNSLEEVRDVLSEHFESHPITEQNLSEWKRGGFRDWQREQKARERVQSLIGLSGEIKDAACGYSVADCLAGVLATELAAEVSTRLEETTDPKERWQYLCDALRRLSSLRHGDRMQVRAERETDRWEVESEERENQEKKKEFQKQCDSAIRPILEALKRPTLVRAFGGNEAVQKAADLILEVNRISSEYDPSAPPPATPAPPAPLSPSEAPGH
jgi:hypothetical protein